MTLREAAENALRCLRHHHGAHIGICPGVAHCPTASAIADLESQLMPRPVMTIISCDLLGGVSEATYPPMIVEDVDQFGTAEFAAAPQQCLDCGATLMASEGILCDKCLDGLNRSFR